MTTLATPAVHRHLRTAAHHRVRPIPFLRLVRVESRKLVDTRAGRGLLIAIGIITAGIDALLLATSAPGDLTFSALATTSAAPYGVLLPILGILAATGEWSQRTALITFALEPRRARVAVAKLVAAGLAGLLAAVVALAWPPWPMSSVCCSSRGEGAWAFPLAQLAGAVLALLLVISVGVAFGLALRSGPLAIVAFLALPTAWTFTSGLVSGLQPLAPWLDLPMATLPLLEATMRAADWAHLGTAGLVWFGLPFLIGVLRLTRHEVK